MSADGSTSEYPRTLVVSEAPLGLNNGFGVTLNTFFQGWPSDRLVLFYTHASTEPLAEAPVRMELADVPGHFGRRYAVDCLLGRRAAWRGHYSRLWLRRALRRWRPDVVYSIMFSPETLAFAAWVSQRVGRPLVAHVADDGISRGDAGRLLGAAAVRVTISEEMRAEYQRRYGLDSHVLHNGASRELFEPTSRPAHAGAFCIRYLGSVVPWHQFNAIEDIAEAARRLRREGMNVHFEICGGSWTRQHAEQLTDRETVTYRGEVSRTDGFALLQTADLLVVPVNFDPVAFQSVRLSFPTKLAECLASGTPTLVYGPPGSGPVEFCRRHGVGNTVETRSTDAVAAFIRACAANRDAARARAARDREFVRREYSATAVQTRFKSILSLATAGRPRLG